MANTKHAISFTAAEAEKLYRHAKTTTQDRALISSLATVVGAEHVEAHF